MDKIKNKLCKICSKKAHLKCEQCKKVSYCSRECQFKDWNRHKANCKYNAKTKLSNEKNDYKRKIDISNNMGFKFNLRTGRRRRHCQTIAIKPQNLSELAHVNTNQKISNEDLDKINEEKNSFEKQQEEEKIDFHFIEKFQCILFRKDNFDKIKNNVSPDSSVEKDDSFEKSNDYKSDRIKKMYSLLIDHRKFLSEKILLNNKRTYHFTSIYVMIDTYYGIEKYIINYLLLIKFLYFQKDPLSLIKADQALNVLGKELFNLNNNKNGLLVFSIDIIFQKFEDVVEKKNNFYQIISTIQDVSKRFLSLISCINKLSQLLQDNKMYIKSLFYYNKFFEKSLGFISTGKNTEKIILRSNLKFNIGCSFTKKKFLNTSLKIYKDILNIQKGLEPCSFICGVVYYNISIIYYIMDKIKESELFLNEGFEKINKILDSKKLNKHREDFRRLIRMLLIFYSELNLERENYPKAVQCLKAVIEIMIDDSQTSKIRHKTQGSKDERNSFKFLKHMKFILANYPKNNNLKAKFQRNTTIERKIKPMTPLEYLYEIQYFPKPSDKVLFEEKMKSMINGLFDKINFHYNEKMKKEKEKNKELFFLRSERKKKTDKAYLEENRKKRADNLIIKEDNLPELNVKNIVKNNNNYKLDFDIDEYTSRERNKTIAKRKRTNFLKEKLNEEKEKEKEKEENENKVNNELKYITKETTNKIINYFNDKMEKKKKIIDNEKDISDFKYFFLLLISLSYRQIELLNNTQNLNMPLHKYKNLPILFTRQFKNSLNPSQRNMFNKLRVLSLIRCKLLKEVNKPISVDNINFGIFHTQLNFNDFKIKQYSHIQDILKEITKYKIKNKTPNKEFSLRKYISFTSIKKRNSNRNSFTDRNEDNNNKGFFKNYNQKLVHKKLQFDDDSNDNGEENEDGFIFGNDDIDFKYKDKYDINKLKHLLIDKIFNEEKYTDKETDILIDIVNSGLFIQLMNSLDLSTIVGFEKDLDTVIEFLKYFKNSKRKEESFIFNSTDENNKSKNIDKISNSSPSNSLDIDIDEKRITYNDIRRTFMLNKPKFNLESNNKDRSGNKLPFIKKENTNACINIGDRQENNEKKKIKKYQKSKTLIIKKFDDSSLDIDIDDVNENNEK